MLGEVKCVGWVVGWVGCVKWVKWVWLSVMGGLGEVGWVGCVK